MKKTSQYLFFLALGGCIYYSFELIFRGFSHWTMFLLGGVCFLFFYIQGAATNWSDPLWLQTLRATIFVVSLEFTTGIIVNKFLNMNVWNYERMPFHLFGQICLPFAIIFSGLCVIGILLSGYISHWFYREEKPHYHVL